MGLKIELLVGARTREDGSIEAQCPACAAGGGDTEERHLVVFPDGAYGCVAYQGDTVHNKEIYSIVGEKTQKGPVVVKVQKAAPNPPKNNAAEVLKKLGAAKPGQNLTKGTEGKEVALMGDLGSILQLTRVREGKPPCAIDSIIIDCNTINSSNENPSRVRALVGKRPPNPPTLKPPAAEAVAEKNGRDAVSEASPDPQMRGDPNDDPAWEISHHPTAPSIKIWRWKSGKIAVAHAGWDGPPPKPMRFVTIPRREDVI